MTEIIEQDSEIKTDEPTAKQQVIAKAQQVLNDDDTWGEINLIIPDDTLTDEETKFAENSNIDELAHNFKQVIFDIGIRNDCLNHVHAHQAVNRLKEAVYWAKEFINNRETKI